VEGHSYEDASLVLEVPVGTVRSRLFRGRRLLQALLLDYARDAGFESVRTSASDASPAERVASPREQT
jgi:RNA polymerase sigma-70 factor (ECF subfamily)